MLSGGDGEDVVLEVVLLSLSFEAMVGTVRSGGGGLGA
jgi:hypothetical protein